MATRQFLYLSRWWGNSTGSVRRHDLTTMRSYDVTRAAVRPGQMVYISNQTPNVQGGILYSSEYNVYFLINVNSINENYEQNSIFIWIKTFNKGSKWQMSKVPVKVYYGHRVQCNCHKRIFFRHQHWITEFLKIIHAWPNSVKKDPLFKKRNCKNHKKKIHPYIFVSYVNWI